jgi:hypothetical protein
MGLPFSEEDEVLSLIITDASMDEFLSTRKREIKTRVQ